MDQGRRETNKRLKELEQKIQKEYKQAEKELQAKMEDHFRAFDRKDVAKQLEVKAGKLSVADYKKWRVGQMAIGKRWEDMKDTVAKDLANTTNIAKSIANGYMPEVYALNMNYATFDIEKKTRMDTSFTLYNTDAVERLMRDDPDLLPPPGKRMTEKIRTGKAIKWEQGQIQSVTTQAILQGESVPNMAKRIANTLCVKDQKVAVRYARTAITEAENAGRLDSYKRAEAMGIKLKKTWLASADGRTRDWHVDLDGQTVGVNESFVNEYGKIAYPGDSGADPANVWNCRCSMVSQIDGFERNPADLSLRPYNKLGGMSYDEWKGAHTRRLVKAIVNGKDLSGTWKRRSDQFDFAIDDIIDAQGFDGLPQVVSPEKFDEAVKVANDGNGFIAQRAYSAPDQETLDAYRDQLYNGKWYVECSGGARLGYGMYCASNDEGELVDSIKETMKEFSENKTSYIETLTLDKSAKIINYHDAREQRQKWLDSLPTQEMRKYRKIDVGSFAAMKGYDAIIEDASGGSATTVILNRTKVIFKGN